MRKSCLRPSPAPSRLPSFDGTSTPGSKKCVNWCKDGCNEVHFADEWDRTPSEPAHNLSYQDILELKAIQNSLPRADQLPDPFTGKRASNFLSKVPIGLVPLLSEDQPTTSGSAAVDTHSPSPTPKPATPSSLARHASPDSIVDSHWASDIGHKPRVVGARTPTPTNQSMTCPPHLAHLRPPQQTQPREKRNFSFLPFYESPQPQQTQPSAMFDQTWTSTQDSEAYTYPPTPALTNDASLENSPLSRASSSSPDPPPFFLMPPSKHSGAYSARDRSYSTSSSSSSDSGVLSDAQSMSKRKKRNVMVINGIEIDLDDDEEEEEEERHPEPAVEQPPPRPIRREEEAPSIFIPRFHRNAPQQAQQSPSPSPSIQTTPKGGCQRLPSPGSAPGSCYRQRSSPSSSPVLMPLA